MENKMDNQTVTMAHGAGGKQTSELIDKVFAAHFANPDLTADDAAVLTPPVGKMAVSTDGFIVSPAFFPGGNIGKLSICGTVNDLACMGAKPLYLTCAFVIEEGFPMEKLEEIAAAMEKTAKEAGVRIVSGDTKVAGKGQVDGVFITTTGMGQIEDGVKIGGELAQPGDAIIVTGDVGRHGCTILLAREDFGIEADVTSDCAPLWHTVEEVINATHDLHVIRDATRGGVGTVLYEIAGQSNVGIRLNAEKVPVAPEVKGVCGMLGLEPLYLACEGRMVIMAPKAEAEKIVEVLHKCPYSQNAAIIGEVTAEKVRIVQDADAIYREEIAKGGLDQDINQYFAALTNMRSVGVMGDERTYDYAVALRAVNTVDFMTAESAEIPFEVLQRVMSRIINEVKGVNRVMYDLTSKPPGTIEFE